jgi:hypothetical protein
MFAYYLELAVRSLRRSPGLTALMVLAIGFGVGASMTTYSVFRAVSATRFHGNPPSSLCRRSTCGVRKDVMALVTTSRPMP